MAAAARRGVVGTLLLTFVAAGGDTIEAATRHPLGHAAKVVAPALMVMALIYAIGGLSGAHLNRAPRSRCWA